MPRPLNKITKGGNAYTRPPSIESSICEALGQDIETQLRRARIRDAADLEYMPTECLLHLVREARIISEHARTVQRSGGSSRLRQLWAWRGDWIEHTTEPGAEHAVVHRAADLKKQIGASPRPSHLLRFIHSPVDQEIRGTFGN